MKTRNQTATFSAIALLLASFCLAGCNDHIDIQDATNPPVPARISTDTIEIKAGIAVGFTAVAKHGNDEVKDKLVEIRSDNPLVVGASPTVREREFVIYGVSKGNAQLTVLFDGEEVQSIPVVVTDQ